MSAERDQGGTWAGATEPLDRLRLVPIYLRSSGELSAGLDALREKGAQPWPNPEGPEGLGAALAVAVPERAGECLHQASLFELGPSSALSASPAPGRHKR